MSLGLGLTVMAGELPTVLVTGAAGYVGSHVTLSLLDAGFAVVALDNLSTGHRWQIDERARFYEGAIENDSFVCTIMDMHKVGSVVHCAGTGSGSTGTDDPLLLYRNNATASRSLIESAVKSKVGRFILLSNSVVPGTRPHPASDNTQCWDAECWPTGPFTRSVLFTELLLADAAAFHGFDYCIVRYANAAGADPQGRCGRTKGSPPDPVGSAIERLFASRSRAPGIEQWSATPERRSVFDVVHVCDLAATIAASLTWLLRHPGQNGTFHCHYDQSYSPAEILDMVEKVTHIRADEGLFDVWNTVAPFSRPQELDLDGGLDWTPKFADLEQLVRDEYRWQLNVLRAG